MILSKNIRSNTKFPHFISQHPVFQTNQQFDKIFPHIGLKNFKIPIEKSTGQIPFILSNAKFGSKTNPSPEESSIWAKLLWKVISTPIFCMDLTMDAVEFFLFKQENKDLHVVFSSDQDEGMWDISTMAMRGVNSCQSWTAGRRGNLIGSMIDPCCGIIYLTDNKEYGYGRNMLHRAIVRYTVHEECGPCLFLERIYSSASVAGEQITRAVNLLFACMLYRKTGLPVVYDFCLLDKDLVSKYMFIPESPIVNQNLVCASYRDSGLSYRPITPKNLKRFPSLSIFKNHFLKK